MSKIKTRVSARLISIVGLALLTTVILVWQALMIRTPTGSTWRGITVGLTTSTDVKRILGDPSSEERLGSSTTIYHYELPEQKLQNAAHEITIRNGVVDLIKEDMGVYYPQNVYLTHYLQTYGAPDHVFWSDFFGRTLLWSKDGVLLGASSLSSTEGIVVFVYYFRPCSLLCVILNFRDRISLTDPTVGTDVISGPRDPWGFTQGLFP